MFKSSLVKAKNKIEVSFRKRIISPNIIVLINKIY